MEVSFFKKINLTRIKSEGVFTFSSQYKIACKHFVFGALGALSFAPFNLYPVFICVFSWLLSEIYSERANLKNAFYLFFGFYLANLYWIAFPLTVDLSKHGVLIPFALIVFPSLFAIQMLIPIIAVKYLKTPILKAIIFSILYCVILKIQGSGEFGFPWIYPAYIWGTHEIFLQTLSIYGVDGLNFITVFISSLLGVAICECEKGKEKSALISLCISFIIFVSICFFGAVRLAENPTEYTDKKIRVVQPTIKHEEKKQRENMMNRLMDLSKKDSCNSANEKKSGFIDLLIWPEASFPYLYSDNLRGLNILLSESLEIERGYLIAGAVREDSATEKIYNSAVVIDRFGRNIDYYDKIHLVPFGEYVPFRKFLPFQNIVNAIGDFEVGKYSDPIQIDDIKISILICYEAIFSNECLNNVENSDVIINLTNDGWFGFTSEPFQHLQIVRARAIETGIPLIRTTNVGISAIFDPLGRIIKSLPIGVVDYFDSYVPTKLKEITIFAKLCKVLRKLK